MKICNKVVLMVLILTFSVAMLATVAGAEDRLTATDVEYYKGVSLIATLKDGEITAKATVTNNQAEGSLTVSMITAEYIVYDSGMKMALEVRKDTQEIPAGESKDFANTLTIASESNRMVQTMIVAEDTLEPVGPVVQMREGEEQKMIYINNVLGENDVPVSVYQINRFANPTAEFVEREIDDQEVPVSIFNIHDFEG